MIEGTWKVRRMIRVLRELNSVILGGREEGRGWWLGLGKLRI